MIHTIQKFTPSGQFTTPMFMGDDPNVQEPGLRAHAIAVTASAWAPAECRGRVGVAGAAIRLRAEVR